YGGSNIYPKQYRPLIKQTELQILCHRVKISLTDPIIRDIKPINTDVFSSGLPTAISSTAVIDKLMCVYKVTIAMGKKANCYGYEDIEN
ncbi:hypothetical protein ACJMK2_013706, partial [Sinanodonta woodiana]